MFTFEKQIRVRYADTDQMGYVYYGNYAQYYEEARTEAFRALGYPYKNLETEGIMMPVRSMNVRYYMPARYDDLLTVKVIIPEMPLAKFIFDYEVYNEEKILINQGSTILVLIEKNTNKILRCPDDLKKIFAPYFS
ncbi:MAG TPA: thioesterase [Microscillaceae bacterium]|jgi:acyl-CoA thioester hydrolase|nr:thioesterase [Microscillaceae bacterium]